MDEDSDIEMRYEGSGNQLGTSRESPVIVRDEQEEATGSASLKSETAVGSALCRNADGTVEAPMVMKRKPKGARVCIIWILMNTG